MDSDTRRSTTTAGDSGAGSAPEEIDVGSLLAELEQLTTPAPAVPLPSRATVSEPSIASPAETLDESLDESLELESAGHDVLAASVEDAQASIEAIAEDLAAVGHAPLDVDRPDRPMPTNDEIDGIFAAPPTTIDEDTDLGDDRPANGPSNDDINAMFDDATPPAAAEAEASATAPDPALAEIDALFETPPTDDAEQTVAEAVAPIEAAPDEREQTVRTAGADSRETVSLDHDHDHDHGQDHEPDSIAIPAAAGTPDHGAVARDAQPDVASAEPPLEQTPVAAAIVVDATTSSTDASPADALESVADVLADVFDGVAAFVDSNVEDATVVERTSVSDRWGPLSLPEDPIDTAVSSTEPSTADLAPQSAAASPEQSVTEGAADVAAGNPADRPESGNAAGVSVATPDSEGPIEPESANAATRADAEAVTAPAEAVESPPAPFAEVEAATVPEIVADVPTPAATPPAPKPVTVPEPASEDPPRSVPDEADAEIEPSLAPEASVADHHLPAPIMKIWRRIEPILMNVFALINAPVQYVPERFRSAVDYIALTLVFWVPVVWVIVLFLLA